MASSTPPEAAEAFSAVGRLRKVTLILLAALAALMLGSLYQHLMVDRHNTIDGAELRAQATAAFAQARTGRTLAETYRVLEGVADVYRIQAEHGDVDEQRLHEIMAAKIKDIPSLFSLTIIRPDGHEIASGRVFPVDKSLDVFEIAPLRPREDSGDRLIYPLHRGIRGDTDKWFLPLGLRIRNKDNSDAAYLITVVRSEIFAEFLDTMNVGDRGSISLWTSEGQLVAAKYKNPTDVGAFVPRIKDVIANTPVEEGVREPVVRLTARESKDQIVAAAFVEFLPLAVFVRLDSQDYLATWRMTQLRFVLAAGVLLLAIGAVASILLRQIAHTHRNEDALRRAKAAAEDANEAKSRFLAHMSHEFRTPLNAIIGFADVIRTKVMGDQIDPIYTSYADHIHRSGEHLLTIVNDILDMAKIESGVQSIQRTPVDVAEVAGRSISFVDQLAHQRELVITREMSTDLPRISGDERFLRQVLINLLSNAVKFSPRGSKIRVRASVDQYGALAIAVIDSGPGIDPTILQRIGEPFLQGNPSLSRVGQGTGLGLSICKHYMNLLGGELVFQSAGGTGTTAIMRFSPSLLIANPAAA